MSVIQRLSAMEILDSRGRPTIKAWCTLADGFTAEVSVPSGASTGAAEALELRDGDPKRYRGLGCLKAVANINDTLNAALAGKSFAGQAELDDRLCQLDGTPDKSHLGANALLAVSLAFARAQALAAHVPLYQQFALMLGEIPHSLPRPTINLFSGGKHAGGQTAIQDVLIVPMADSINQSLAMAYEVYQTAASLIGTKYGARALKADEGGLAPPFPDTETMFKDAVETIETAGYQLGKEVALAVDVASSHFYHDGLYDIDGQSLSGDEMIDRLLQWIENYPIISVEDGLAEEDWPSWEKFRRRSDGQTLILGDDLLCTNPGRIQKAIDRKAANSLLLKVNQIGTVSEALDAYRLARTAGWSVVVSARSGETEDNWLADLAVGWSGDYIKIGSIAQSERLAKYNRLLEIEAQTGFKSLVFSH
jgi:enolase